MPTLCLDVEATLTELLSEEGEVGGGMGERKNRLFLLLSILSKGYNHRYIQPLNYANKEAKASRRIGIFPGSPRDSVRRRVWSPGF